MAQTKTLALPKVSWGNVSLMSVGHFCSDFFCNVLPVMLPILAQRYGISYSQSAALFMVFSVSTNFLQPPIGILADKKNIGILMPLSIATGAVFASLVGLAPGLIPLIFIILLSGICSSAFHPIAALSVYAVSIKRKRSLCTSIFIAGGNVGFAFAPVIIAAYIETFSDKSLWILSLPALIVAALVIKQKLHCLEPKHNPIEQKENFFSLLKGNFLWLNLAIALRSWCYCAFVVFLPLLLTSQGHSTVEAAFALMILLVGTVVGGLLAGSLSDYFGLKLIIQSTFIVTILGCAVFLYKCDISLISLCALFVMGAGMYGSTPSAIVWAQRIMPSHAAFAASMMLGFTFGMGYIESVLTGLVGDFVGLRLALATTVLPAVVLAIVIIAILKEPADEKKQDLKV